MRPCSALSLKTCHHGRSASEPASAGATCDRKSLGGVTSGRRYSGPTTQPPTLTATASTAGNLQGIDLIEARVSTGNLLALIDRRKHLAESRQREDRIGAADREHLGEKRPHHAQVRIAEQHCLRETDEVRRRHELHGFLQTP